MSIEEQNRLIRQKNGFPSYLLFWCLAFLYSCFLAIVLQKLVLPMIPSLHAEHGLMNNDAIVFHNIAYKKSQEILESGWSHWTLFPSGVPANIGLLSALYVLLGPDPVWFVPFNAAAHALGATALYWMGSTLLPGRRGHLGGLIAAILLLTYPSALQWYGQNHKDSFAYSGVLMLLGSWLQLSGKSDVSRKKMLELAAISFCGTMLFGLVRPHFPFIVLALLIFSSCVSVGVSGLRSKILPSLASLKRFFVLTIVVAAVGIFVAQFNTRTDLAADHFDNLPNYDQMISSWKWEETEYLPEVIDEVFNKVSHLRVYFIGYGRFVGAGSEIDGDIRPRNIKEALHYIPRAIVVGLLEPFPTFWVEKPTFPRLIATVETVAWYFVSAGAFLILWRHANPRIVTGLMFCLLIIGLLAYVYANIGTLYRQRYGFWMFILLCGSVGWVDYFARAIVRLSKGRSAERLSVGVSEVVEQNYPSDELRPQKMEKVASSGIIAVVLTIVCFLGFFARDLILVNRLGMTMELDAFFGGSMVPMFLVTFMAMPMADSLMLPFVQFTKNQDAQRQQYISKLLGLAVCILGGATLLSMLLSPTSARLVLGFDAGAERLNETEWVLRCFSLIIVLSAWTIIGNAILNALQMSRIAASVQLIVPVIAIAFVFLVPDNQIAEAAAIGMVSGTLCNCLIVAFHVRRRGISLVPVWSFPWPTELSQTTKSYVRLSFAAFLTAALIPLNYTFAGTSGEGAVSTWAFSSKVVVFFTALTTYGVTAVVLPHFARLVGLGRKAQFRDHIYFMLIAGGWLGAIVAFSIFSLADPMIRAIVTNEGISQGHISSLINLVRVGVLQLPFVIPGLLLVKAAAVTDSSSRVMISAGLAFIVNFLINFLLIDRLGMIAIAAGALAAAVSYALVLALLTHRKAGLSIRELMTLIVSWLVWIAACLAFISDSWATILSGVLGLALIFLVQVQVWRKDR